MMACGQDAALGAFATLANSLTHCRFHYRNDSSATVPVIHSLWIALPPCGKPVWTNRMESRTAGMNLTLLFLPLIYPQPTNKTVPWPTASTFISCLTPPAKRWRISQKRRWCSLTGWMMSSNISGRWCGRKITLSVSFWMSPRTPASSFSHW